MTSVLVRSSLVLVVATASALSARAGTYYYSGALTSTSPAFTAPGASRFGSGQEFYSVLQFTVGTTGAYSFEHASPNTASSSTASNALDTFLQLYAGTFVPAQPGTPIAQNDDYTGTFSVLPGPFANVSAQSTASVGAQPGSRIPTATLTAGLSYFLINTGYRDTTFVDPGTNPLRVGGATGNFYTGVSGVGTVNVAPVPEPSAFAALALGAVAILRRRKRA